MPDLRDVVGHFTIKAALVLAGFAVQLLLQHAPRPGRRPGANAQQRQQQRQQSQVAQAVDQQPAHGAPQATQQYRVITRLETEYQASNPKWLVTAAQLTPADLAANPPELPPALMELQQSMDSGAQPTPLPTGADARELFALDALYTYLNHGSYGAAFQVALQAQQWYRDRLEAQPVKFMETDAMAGVVKATADAAAFVGADYLDVVPVINATSAVNAVVASIRVEAGDVLLMTTATYPAVRSTLACAAAATGAGLLEVQLALDTLLHEEQIVAAFAAAVEAAGNKLKLAVLDHVLSFPPVVLPVKRLTRICRDAGALVLVDGSHAIGALPDLHIPSINAHYYTTNLHKWCCTPKGCALLWAARDQQESLRPVVVSHGSGLGWRAEFLWQGTQDMTAWLAASASLALLRSLGPQRVAAHNRALVVEAAALLMRRWRTQRTLGLSDAEGGAPGAPMVAVELPAGLGRVLLPGPAGAEELKAELRAQHRIEVPVAFVEGALWVRISAQLYNQIGDYERLSEVVLAIQARGAPATTEDSTAGAGADDASHDNAAAVSERAAAAGPA